MKNFDLQGFPAIQGFYEKRIQTIENTGFFALRFLHISEEIENERLIK